MRVAAAVTVAVLALGGCLGGPQEPTKPTFGGGSSSAPDPDELARAKAAARIEDCPPTKQTAPVSNGMSSLVLECLGGGRPVHLAGLRGKPTVVNLWASWCGPCKEELPLLAKAHRELGDRVQVIGIDFADGEPDAALDLAARAGVTYPLLADPKSSVKRTLDVVALPQTVFIDRQGTIVATERRAYRSYEDLTDAITKHLGVTP